MRLPLLPAAILAFGVACCFDPVRNSELTAPVAESALHLPAIGPEAPLESGTSAEIYYMDWSILTRFRYSIEDVKRSSDQQGQVQAAANLRTLAAMLSASQEWEAASELPGIDGRFFAIVQIEGQAEQELFASRFFICNLTLNRCRENDEAFRETIARIAEEELPSPSFGVAP